MRRRRDNYYDDDDRLSICGSINVQILTKTPAIIQVSTVEGSN